MFKCFSALDNNHILFMKEESFPGAINSLLLSFRNKDMSVEICCLARFELSPLFYTLLALNRRSPSAVQEYKVLL